MQVWQVVLAAFLANSYSLKKINMNFIGNDEMIRTFDEKVLIIKTHLNVIGLNYKN